MHNDPPRQKYGNSPRYLADRLKRERPDLGFDETERGSVRRAAIAAGIVRAPSTLDRMLLAWERTPMDARAGAKRLWQISAETSDGLRAGFPTMWAAWDRASLQERGAFIKLMREWALASEEDRAAFLTMIGEGS